MERSIEELLSKKKPVLVLVGHGGVPYSVHPSVHLAYHPDANSEIEALRLNLRNLLRGENVPEIGIAVKRVWRGDFHTLSEIKYLFPDSAGVIEEFGKRLDEDSVLKRAVRLFLRYGEGWKEGVFRVKRTPVTRSAASVGYILHSLSLSTISSLGLDAPHYRIYHERRLKKMKKVLES